MALKDVNGDKDAFANAAKKIAETSEFNLVLMTEDPGVMKAAVDVCGFKRPLMYAATDNNVDALGAIAKEQNLPLAVRADSVEGLIPLTDKLAEMEALLLSEMRRLDDPYCLWNQPDDGLEPPSLRGQPTQNKKKTKRKE